MELSAYNSLHTWLSKNFKKPKRCENKNCSGFSKRIEWANISGEYKKERGDYKALCVSCHRKLDYQTRFGNKCKRGHEYTPKNTYIRNKEKGWRVCVICHNLRTAKHKNKQHES